MRAVMEKWVEKLSRLHKFKVLSRFPLDNLANRIYVTVRETSSIGRSDFPLSVLSTGRSDKVTFNIQSSLHQLGRGKTKP